MDHKEAMRNYRISSNLSQAEMAEKLGISQQVYANIELGRTKKLSPDFVVKFREITGINLWDIQPYVVDDPEEPYKRQPKTETDPEKEGIRFVPISAQAGYGRRMLEPMFMKQLEKLYIPGFPYRGDRYSVFEVEGNSMEPTFKEHYHVLTEKVDPEGWSQIKQYYAYVVVTQDDVLIKRIKRSKQKGFWVLISDNEVYEPFLMPIEVVKELWLVKRKMDWEMSPPKRFEIDM